MAAHDDVLSELGFTADEELQAAHQADANDATTGEGSLSHNGPYQVQGYWTKGDVHVHLERNTAPEADNGDDMTAIVTHPPVFVVSKGEERVGTAMLRDPEALKAVLSDLG